MGAREGALNQRRKRKSSSSLQFYQINQRKSLTRKMVIPEKQETRSETSLQNEKDLSQLMRKRSLSLPQSSRSKPQKNLKKKTKRLENNEKKFVMNLVREGVSSRPKKRKSSSSLQFYRRNQRKSNPQKNL